VAFLFASAEVLAIVGESTMISKKLVLILSALAGIATAFSLKSRTANAIEKADSLMKGAFVSGALLCGAAGIAVPPALAGDREAGEKVFAANCAACHAGGQNVIMPEKTLEKDALDTYLYGGRTEAAVIKQVTNGKNAMPAFGGRLGEENIANVASYVISMSEAGWDE